MNSLTTWTEYNHMALHPKKSKLMIVSTRQKRQNMKSDLVKIKVKDMILEEVDSHTVLGLGIDNNLSWNFHVSKLTRKLSRKIFQLNRIKHFLDQHTRRLFFHACIQPDIDYASIAYDLASRNCLRYLESAYRRAVKLILLKSSSLTTSDYKTVNILPFDLRMKFNKAVFMFKIIKGLTPNYLTENFTLGHIRNKPIPFICPGQELIYL